MSKKIAFIGVGNMATATLMGITAQKEDLTDIILYNRHKEKIEKYRTMGAFIADSLREVVERADIVMLCVKPQNFPDILPELSCCNDVSSKIFVTMAAGITMKAVSDAAMGAPVVRVMPNTPMLIGQGVIAACRNEFVSDEDYEYICELFSLSGKVVRIDEGEMNRIISVTGSSPAYVFMLIRAMYEGAVEQGLLSDGTGHGLSEKELIDSICDTIIGSAQLMKSGNKTPDEQIATVASKGGTTERAIAELEEYRFCEGVISAMKKCTKRADELG